MCLSRMRRSLAPIARADRSRRQQVVVLHHRDHLRTNDARGAGGEEHAECGDDRTGAGADDRDDEDDEDQAGQAMDDVDEPLEQQVEQPAVVAGRRTDRAGGRRRDGHGPEPDQDRGPRPEDHAAEHVPALDVGPERVTQGRPDQAIDDVVIVVGVRRDPSSEEPHQQQHGAAQRFTEDPAPLAVEANRRLRPGRPVAAAVSPTAPSAAPRSCPLLPILSRPRRVASSF